MSSQVFSAQMLADLDFRQTDIRQAISSGRLQRIARGWYAGPLAHPDVVRAIQMQGRIGCLTGCHLHGVWTPRHSEPHVILNRNGVAGLGVEAHRVRGSLPRVPLLPLTDCLAQVIRHHDEESALMVLESAVNQGLLPEADASMLIAEAPQSKQRVLRFFDPAAQSGSETRVRLFLQRHRFPVRSQVEIPPIGHVDMLVGKSHILECDSERHHGTPSGQNEDRRRDLVAVDLGYSYSRLSYPQVHDSWSATQEVLLRLFRTQLHLREPVPLQS